MDAPIVGGILAFLAGLCVSGLNFALNLYVLKKSPESLARVSPLRQVLSVGCLVAAYLLSGVLPWGHVPLLVGTALGLTVPSVLLSLRLARINDERAAGAGDPADERAAPEDGAAGKEARDE